jgi:hypothetical protein
MMFLIDEAVTAAAGLEGPVAWAWAASAPGGPSRPVAAAAGAVVSGCALAAVSSVAFSEVDLRKDGHVR